MHTVNSANFCTYVDLHHDVSEKYWSDRVNSEEQMRRSGMKYLSEIPKKTEDKIGWSCVETDERQIFIK